MNGFKGEGNSCPIEKNRGDCNPKAHSLLSYSFRQGREFLGKHTSVYLQDLTGNVFRHIRTEENAGVSYLFGLPSTL